MVRVCSISWQTNTWFFIPSKNFVVALTYCTVQPCCGVWHQDSLERGNTEAGGLGEEGGIRVLRSSSSLSLATSFPWFTTCSSPKPSHCWGCKVVPCLQRETMKADFEVTSSAASQQILPSKAMSLGKRLRNEGLEWSVAQTSHRHYLGYMLYPRCWPLRYHFHGHSSIQGLSSHKHQTDTMTPLPQVSGSGGKAALVLYTYFNLATMRESLKRKVTFPHSPEPGSPAHVYSGLVLTTRSTLRTWSVSREGQ